MELDLFVKLLKDNNIKYILNERMRKHTSFKIGGMADVFVTVCTCNQLNEVINGCKNYDVPIFILGRGSNVLVSDKGIEGAVVSLSGIDYINVEGDTVVCGAGASLSNVCRVACDNCLQGMEFAYGIPGSIGGALFMNAGAYGGEMAQIVSSAKCIDLNGEIETIELPQMNLGYRTSVFRNNNKIITDVTFKLNCGNKDEICSKMNDLIERRKTKQPLEYPSAGSTFKRPEGAYAGALIEKNGLKGYCCGGAMVSDKHAGFIINYDNATCSDVCNLIETVKEKVFNGDGIKLEPEVIVVGRK